MARINQKMLASKLPSGALDAQLTIVDKVNLRFTAVVTEMGGAGQEYEICDDAGELRKFTDADDFIRFVNSTYNGMAGLKINFVGLALIAKKFTVPKDPLADAKKWLDYWTKAKTAIADKVASTKAKSDAAVAQGYNTSTNPALVALATELKDKADFVAEVDTYYAAQVAKYNAIVNP